MKPSSMSSSSTVPANRMPMAVRSFPAAAASSQSMIRSAMSAPYLEREEERALAIRWKETKDQDALHRITSAHMRLVISMAGRFRKFKLPMSDLIQEGYVGLLEAAARFDPDRDVRFRPMHPGGFVPPCRIISCATGLSFVVAQARRRKHCFQPAPPAFQSSRRLTTT